MEKYLVSARKYRPQTFDAVVGQQHIVKTLKNAIKTGQLAHAYLFCGPRGVGKTTTARIFAKTINCENPTPDVEPCNQCASCKAFNEGKSLNIHELDAASNNSVEDIRSLIEQVRIPPQTGKYSVYIIDEVHMLSQAAFNAFLKTLEEPPEYAIFILATTEKHKIIPTILSRCQIFDFNRIKVSDIVEHLKKIAQKEGIYAEEEALHIIAQKADGGLRDALSYFDQIASFSNNHITYQNVIENLNVLDYEYYFQLTDFFKNDNFADALLTFDQILKKGFDEHNFIIGLAEHFRNLLILKNKNTEKLFDFGENIKKKYIQQAQKIPVNFLLKALDIVNDFDVNFQKAKNKRLHIELMLIKLAQINELLNQKNILIQQQIQQPTVQKTQQVKQTSETIKEPVQQSKQEISVNNILQKSRELQQNYEKLVELSQQNLLAQWRKISEQFADSPRLKIIFAKLTPKLEADNQTINIELLSNSQKDDFSAVKSKVEKILSEYFGKNLKIRISLKPQSTSQTPKTKKLSTSQKIKFLTSKNPNVKTLIEKFGLNPKT